MLQQKVISFFQYQKDRKWVANCCLEVSCSLEMIGVRPLGELKINLLGLFVIMRRFPDQYTWYEISILQRVFSVCQ